jgi:hypothetical protein
MWLWPRLDGGWGEQMSAIHADKLQKRSYVCLEPQMKTLMRALSGVVTAFLPDLGERYERTEPQGESKNGTGPQHRRTTLEWGSQCGTWSKNVTRMVSHAIPTGKLPAPGPGILLVPRESKHMTHYSIHSRLTQCSMVLDGVCKIGN